MNITEDHIFGIAVALVVATIFGFLFLLCVAPYYSFKRKFDKWVDEQ